MENNTLPSSSASSNQQQAPPRSATEILKRRQKFLAKRWKRHEYALYDLFTIIFSFIDVRKHFIELALVNKWFYHQVHECLTAVEELVFVDERELSTKFLDKLYSTKILKNYLQFHNDDQEEELIDSEEKELNEKVNEYIENIEKEKEGEGTFELDESSDHGIFNDFLSTLKSFGFGKGTFGAVQSSNPPPPTTVGIQLNHTTSTKDHYLLKRLIISIDLHYCLSHFRNYKVEKIYMIGTFSKYSTTLPAIEKQGVAFDQLLLFRCGIMVEGYFYGRSLDLSAYHKATYINSSFSGTNAREIDTSRMEIDKIVEMMQEHDIFTISPSLVQFKTNEIMEYLKFEKSGSASSGNVLWKALKNHENLYPYLQQVFGDLGVYYLKSMVSEMSSILERNFRTFLEKWNSLTQVRKIRLEFIITNTIYHDKTIENFIREAGEIDKALEKKKSLAVEKCKLESWSKWVSDLYKNRPNKKKIDIILL